MSYSLHVNGFFYQPKPTVALWSHDEIVLSTMVHWCPLPSYKRTEINLFCCRIRVIHSTEHAHAPHTLHASFISSIPSYMFPSPHFCLFIFFSTLQVPLFVFLYYLHLTSLCTSVLQTRSVFTFFLSFTLSLL